MFIKQRRNDERRIRRLLANIERKQNELLMDASALVAAVAANTDAVNAAVAKITASSTPSQAELDAITATVNSNNAALNAAVTPAAPAA